MHWRIYSSAVDDCPTRPRRAHENRRKSSPKRLRGFERLECRRLLEAVTWTGMGDQHSWADKNNWSGGTVPGQSDDVTISAGAGTTINIAHGELDSINSLVSNSPIVDGGTLTVATTATDQRQLDGRRGIARRDVEFHERGCNERQRILHRQH